MPEHSKPQAHRESDLFTQSARILNASLDFGDHRHVCDIIGLGEAKTMRAAMYYPSMSVEDEGILKTGLLLWDRIDCIVPYKEDLYFGNDRLRPAQELLVRGIVPNKNQKKRAHDLILEIATSEVPSEYLISDEECRTGNFYMYPQKLMDETFDALRETKLAEAGSDYWHLEERFGITIMALLAEACAGTRKATVTDTDLAHTMLLRSISGLHGGEQVGPNSEHERLVNIAIDVVDIDGMPLDSLIDFRMREDGSSEGRHIKKLRHSFSEKIDAMAVKSLDLFADGYSQEDISAYCREVFSDDLQSLKDALKREAWNFVGTKPIVVSLLAAATYAFPAIGVAAGAATCFSLPDSATKYQKGRRAALEKHPMAWLYSATRTDPRDYLYRIGPIPAIG